MLNTVLLFTFLIKSFFLFRISFHTTVTVFTHTSSSVILCDWDIQVGVGGSHRTLLYGQAVLFLHSFSGMVGRLYIMPK